MLAYTPTYLATGIGVKFPDFVRGISLSTLVNFEKNSLEDQQSDWAIDIDVRMTFSTVLLLNFLKLYITPQLSVVFQSSGTNHGFDDATGGGTTYYTSPGFGVGASLIFGLSVSLGPVFAVFAEGGIGSDPYALSHENGGVISSFSPPILRTGINFFIPPKSTNGAQR